MQALNLGTVYELPNGQHYVAVLMLRPVPDPTHELLPPYVVGDDGHILLAHIAPPVYGKLDEDGNPTDTLFDARTHEPVSPDALDALCQTQASTAWTVDDLIPVDADEDPDDPPT